MPAMVMMERAGLAVYGALAKLLPEGGKVMVVCGKGHNGGDGFAVARLAMQHGYQVECLVTSSERELRDGCRQQMLQCRAQGLQPVFYDDGRFARRLEQLGKADLIIDAILGTGTAGSITGGVQDAIHAINRSGVPVLAIDVPSGIHPDTGEEMDESIWALRTVTLGLPKPYLFQGIGMEHAGYWSVEQIGYPCELLCAPTHARLMDEAWAGSLIPERLRASHKGANGHMLLVAGSDRYRGATVLAAKAAYRAGAGMVTVAAVEKVCAAVAAQVPEAILLPLPEVDGLVSPAAADVILQNHTRFTASVFGPGLTHEAPVVEFLQRIWARWELSAVVDADALNAASMGVELPAAPCVLTPHPGELSRLLQVPIPMLQADRFASVRQAVAMTGKTVLLKGPFSIIGAPDEPLNVNPTGNPGMASAGMGDVLAGMIGTLMAQDVPPYEAASASVFWHGLAGDLCAQEMGGIGFVARDVAQALPRARAKLTAS